VSGPERVARERVFGIDLGTTYSCITRVDEYGRPEVLANSDGQLTTPSVVLFDTPADVVVGVQAKRQARIRPEAVASLVKRHMGDGEWRFRVYGEEYSAPAIASQVLRALADDAARAGGEPVRDVVITVPAYFGDAERKATKLAGELAGLRVVDILNEPTAAAFAYGLGGVGLVPAQRAADAPERTVLVYDLGGGTFDTTVIRLSAGRIDVVATDGDHELGGADWDDRVADHLARAFVERCPDAGDPLDDSYGVQDLQNEAEQAKQSLSARESVDVLVVFGGDRASVTVTRQEFEQLTAGLLERTIDLTAKVLAAAAAKGVDRVDTVLLVGGMAKMPAVARRLAEAVGVEPTLADPDLAVAKGAALYGQKKELEAHVLTDLVARGALDEGATAGDLAAALPADVEAALQAAALEYGLTTMAVATLVSTEVANVTSRGFGLLAVNDVSQTVQAVFLAHQNDPLPIDVEQTFYTVEDDQDHVRVRIVEQDTGVESVHEFDNKVVVEGVIGGIPRGHPRGTPVRVMFSMRRDQTIEVVARHDAVPEPLVLRVEAGIASAAVRAEEWAKVAALHHRT
jgi:molecular chaperone DnaK